jgi:N-acetylglucosamine repressor
MGIRKINTRNFRLATRSTPRDVNRQIVLNLIREHQPISRAELARRMNVRRGAVTAIVRELVESGVVDERGTAAVVRGRRPKMLWVHTRNRVVAAVDVRPRRTAIALADFDGRVLSREDFETPEAPDGLAEEIAKRVGRLAEEATARGATAEFEGVGIVVPGMVDRRLGRLIYSPRLGWRDVELRSVITERLGIPVFVESAPIACAMARLWLAPEETRAVRSFAYVHVSDGVGVGLVLNGEPLRGESHTAGEFGHVSLDPDGPSCVCGRRGCWEAFACNSATIDRYAERVFGGATRTAAGRGAMDIAEVVRRARSGEEAAAEAVLETGRLIGRGLANVVSAFNPGHIFLGGEITAAWELLEGPIRDAMREGSLTESARITPVTPDNSPAEDRLLGAVAIVAAPSFAAPRIA